MKLFKGIGVMVLVGMLTMAPISTMALETTTSITLEWEHDGIDLDHFTLYTSTDGIVFDVAATFTPVNLSGGVYTLNKTLTSTDGAETTFYFKLSASDSDNNESAFSNVAMYTVDSLSPNAPFQLRIIIN